jgi:hypothetical protein
VLGRCKGDGLRVVARYIVMPGNTEKERSRNLEGADIRQWSEKCKDSGVHISHAAALCIDAGRAHANNYLFFQSSQREAIVLVLPPIDEK